MYDCLSSRQRKYKLPCSKILVKPMVAHVRTKVYEYRVYFEKTEYRVYFEKTMIISISTSERNLSRFTVLIIFVHRIYFFYFRLFR